MKIFFIILLMWMALQYECDCMWENGNEVCRGPNIIQRSLVDAARQRIVDNQNAAKQRILDNQLMEKQADEKEMDAKFLQYCVDDAFRLAKTTEAMRVIDAGLADSTTMENWFPVDIDISVCVFKRIVDRSFDAEYHLQDRRMLINFDKDVSKSKFVTKVHDDLLNRVHAVHQIPYKEGMTNILRYYFEHREWLIKDAKCNHSVWCWYRISNGMWSSWYYHDLHYVHACELEIEITHF